MSITPDVCPLIENCPMMPCDGPCPMERWDFYSQTYGKEDTIKRFKEMTGNV